MFLVQTYRRSYYHSTETNGPSTQSIQELLTAHLVSNCIWDHINLCDISIDTVNSAEAMAGSHIVEPEYISCKPNPGFEYIKHVVDVASDTIKEDRLYKFIYEQIQQMGRFAKHSYYW